MRRRKSYGSLCQSFEKREGEEKGEPVRVEALKRERAHAIEGRKA